jgi:voltage-gated potassium channel Kch
MHRPAPRSTLQRLFAVENFRWAILVAVVVVAVSATGFILVEEEQNLDAWDAAYWAVTTVTGVGYGDITPRTHPGRAFTIAVMVTSLALIALLTATLVQLLVASGVKRGLESEGEREADVGVRLDEVARRLEALERAVRERDP